MVSAKWSPCVSSVELRGGFPACRCDRVQIVLGGHRRQAREHITEVSCRRDSTTRRWTVSVRPSATPACKISRARDSGKRSWRNSGERSLSSCWPRLPASRVKDPDTWDRKKSLGRLNECTQAAARRTFMLSCETASAPPARTAATPSRQSRWRRRRSTTLTGESQLAAGRRASLRSLHTQRWAAVW